ncbi:hypothetical protein [Morganella morganii]|uniref:hypothetical protein n=1 Tax=Morganella morganii TaxID=582 RepID=UPI001F11C673|nr:hypothetical protein [Morganella morganii]
MQMVPGLVQQIHQVVQLVPIVVQELHARISNDPVIDPDNKNINPVRGKAKSKTVMPENFAPSPNTTH